MTPRTPVAFIDWLVGRHARLEPVLDEHLNDYDELLAHVFFADLTRDAAQLARRAERDEEAEAELCRLLGDLETALRAAEERDDVDDLIWVSFVENAQGVAGDEEEQLRSYVRRYPRRAAALSHYDN